ncbi:hypothetical protein [Amycolatopsis minnesotensis]|uniref:hypothetical protein n=1 Tax=Amycolatopsis minnesotensis TaxID=337894 RepID=UPI0031D20D08
MDDGRESVARECVAQVYQRNPFLSLNSRSPSPRKFVMYEKGKWLAAIRRRHG